MPDASTMDPAAVLQRVEDYVNGDSLVVTYGFGDKGKAAFKHDLATLVISLRTALADTQQVKQEHHASQAALTLSENLREAAAGAIASLRAQRDAALADTRRVDWQPIETAPKGQELLLFFPATGRSRMPLPEMMRVDRYPASFSRKPTHWMLPPGPPDAAMAATPREE